MEKTSSKTSASYENTSDVFIFLCSCLLVSGVLSHGWCAVLSFGCSHSTFALLWHDLEMVVTWLVGLRYGMVLSWAFLYEFVCIWKTLSCPDWMKRWIGFWRALTVSKHGKEAEDGSVGLFALSCFLLWKTFPCSSEWRDRSASKHRKQKMEVICFVSLFALLFVCVWKTVSPPVHSHLKKRQID